MNQKGSTGRKVDPSIEAFFGTNPTRKLDVLVVIDAPQPDLSFLLGKGAGGGPSDIILPDRKSVEQISDRVREELLSLDVVDPVWLPSAQSFVAKLDASQVKKISQRSDVLEIVPNERLK